MVILDVSLQSCKNENGGKERRKLLGESVEEKGKSDRVCVWEEGTQIIKMYSYKDG